MGVTEGVVDGSWGPWLVAFWHVSFCCDGVFSSLCIHFVCVRHLFFLKNTFKAV